MSFFGTLKGLISDTVARIVRVDPSTNTLQAITYPHHEVHGGSMFRFWTYDADLDDTNTIDLIITTPNTTEWGHFEWEVIGALKTLVQLFEGTTHTPGAAQAIFNANRNSAHANTLTIHISNDDNADGTVIDGVSFGVATGAGINAVSGGGEGRGGHEWELDQNNKYLFRVTSGADNNNVTIKFSWYEHTDKD